MNHCVMLRRFWEILGFTAAFVFIFEGRALVSQSQPTFHPGNVCFFSNTQKEAVRALEEHYGVQAHLRSENQEYYFVSEEENDLVEWPVRLYSVWDERVKHDRVKACL